MDQKCPLPPVSTWRVLHDYLRCKYGQTRCPSCSHIVTPHQGVEFHSKQVMILDHTEFHRRHALLPCYLVDQNDIHCGNRKWRPRIEDEPWLFRFLKSSYAFKVCDIQVIMGDKWVQLVDQDSYGMIPLMEYVKTRMFPSCQYDLDASDPCRITVSFPTDSLQTRFMEWFNVENVIFDKSMSPIVCKCMDRFLPYDIADYLCTFLCKSFVKNET